MPENNTALNFRDLCKQWRKFRKLSQLDLALTADVSQRHVSWLETGRSLPSREMVVRLSDAMEIPLRERNALFKAAGFSPVYTETDLDDPAMAQVLDALNKILEHHNPLPAVVLDRFWNVKRKNDAANMLFNLGDSADELLKRIGDNGEFNLCLLTVHPEGLRKYITNWDVIAPGFVHRVRMDALASGDAEVQQRMQQYMELTEPLAENSVPHNNLLPVLPLELNIDGLELSFFSVISTLGTPQDITTDELRIETFYPANEKTRLFFNSLEEGNA